MVVPLVAFIWQTLVDRLACAQLAKIVKHPKVSVRSLGANLKPTIYRYPCWQYYTETDARAHRQHEDNAAIWMPWPEKWKSLSFASILNVCSSFRDSKCNRNSSQINVLKFANALSQENINWNANDDKLYTFSGAFVYLEQLEHLKL